MASISVDVDVNIEDFDLDDILDELDERYIFSDDSRRKIDDWLNQFSKFPLKTVTILDEIKIDFLRKNLDKIKLSDLENLI